MHRLYQTLLHDRQLDVGLVSALAFHTGRDTANDNDDIHIFHFLSEAVELDRLTLTDIAT